MRIIGLTGQMHGLVYLDASGDACSPLYTWQDKRCDLMVPGSHESYAQRLTRLTGYPMATGFGVATHAWHTANHCIPQGAVCFVTIHDYIGMKLTGRTSALTHISDAASLGLWDARAFAFDQAAIERAGLDPSFFPRVATDAALLGHTRGGVPVSVAIGDNQAGYIGAVRDMQNSVMINVGTSGQVTLVSDAFKLPSCLESRPLSGSDSILVGSALCGGSAYAQLRAFLRSCLALTGADTGVDLYPAMNALGEQALSFGDKLTVDTRFAGTRQRPDVHGAISGISKHNLTAAHLIGGVLEGIAGELHVLYDEMLNAGAAPRTVLVGAGNALRHNATLVKAFEAAFALPMQMPAHDEEAAHGAALFGLAAAGICTLKQAQALIDYLPRTTG